MKVREYLESMCFADNDIVFLRKYRGKSDEKYLVSDIPKKLLNKELMTVQSHFGGIEHNYSSYRLITTK